MPNSDDYSIGIWLGNGNGTFQNPILYPIDADPIFIIVNDFNNDTKIDLAVTNSFEDTVNVLLGYENGSFHQQTKFTVGKTPLSIIVGDFNNDKKPRFDSD